MMSFQFQNSWQGKDQEIMHSITENKEFIQRAANVTEWISFQKKGLGPWLIKECSQYTPMFCAQNYKSSC